MRLLLKNNNNYGSLHTLSAMGTNLVGRHVELVQRSFNFEPRHSD